MAVSHLATHPLPDLRIVSTEQLVAHERRERHRAEALAQLLRADGILRNPPLVSPLGPDSPGYVIMDGANRVAALSIVGAPHTLVQIVDYGSGQVELFAWNHLVTNMGWEDLLAALSEIDGLETVPMDREESDEGLARRELAACLVSPRGDLYGLRGGHDLSSRVALARAVSDTYKERGYLHRTTAQSIEELTQYYGEIGGLLLFPRYHPEEILALAKSGEYLPSGVTRHLIACRALRVNYPLEELMSDRSLEDKNQRLVEWLRRKLAAREIRYYAESTYLFDE